MSWRRNAQRANGAIFVFGKCPTRKRLSGHEDIYYLGRASRAEIYVNIGTELNVLDFGIRQEQFQLVSVANAPNAPLLGSGPAGTKKLRQSVGNIHPLVCQNTVHFLHEPI